MADFNLGTVTAYGYARDKGYTGTEAEFAELMASYAQVAEDAAESTEQAAQSASTAATKASEASASATDAANANTAAQAAKTGAETAAQTATTKADEASGSATTASTKATEAATSATSAAQSATTATTKAGEAATSATNAAASATSAAGSAQTAQDVADSIPADYSQMSEDVGTLKTDVSALKEDLPNTYVALAGENQVTPQNIAGVTFTKTQEEIAGENIFSEIYLGENGYYASIDTSVNPPIIAHASTDSFRWYAIPVDGEKKYRFTEARFACLAKGNTVGSEAIGTTLANVTEVTTTSETTYLILSYRSSITNVEVHPITVEDVYSDFVLPDWLKGGVAKPKHISTTGNLSDGSFIALMGYKQNLRKGERYVFSGDLTTMSELHFGFTLANSFSASTKIFNEFTIDGTYITYKKDSTSSSYNNRYEHGLTLTNNIQFIFEYLPEGNAKITLITNGMMFSQTLPFVKQTISQVVVLSDGSTLQNCKLSWIPTDIDKALWMFGDSYFAYAPARWTYYLHQYGYAENALIDGWPGEGSVNARNSLLTLIKFGTPEYIVWCMGMNDGSDTDASTPNTDWATRRDEMLTICDKNGVTPIFATIPNVPSILHTGKNAWIKASGYRYIDFAAAVGAESAGATWFSGMLSSDNVHPTEQGAMALFARALVDLPELMLGK